MNLGMKPLSYPSSSTSWTSCDRVPDQFPAGLRVLVVDDDPTCLRILEQMLRICLYEVTKCNRAEIALNLLRGNRTGYDIVISDVHMPDMDGFKLLEHVGLEMDLPVIMMSADDGKNVVMKGVTHGACDYLIKPVRMEALKNIWQHVVRKKKHEWKDKDNGQSGLSLEDGERNQKGSEDVDYSSSANDESWKSSKRRKDEEDDSEDRDDSSTLKKPRVVWSVDLHQQFVTAVNQLGIDKAVPKKILELMNVPGLTRENVASHLQKYRLYLRRLSGASSHQNGLGNSFIGSPDPIFGPINAFDLQALAASGQLPPQSLATIQVGAALGRAASKSNISPALVDQINIFSFENPNVWLLDGQQQNNNSKQPNLLHGIPINMDSKQLVTLHQSAPYQSNSLLTQMVQVQPQPHILNEINCSRVSNLPSISSANGPSYRSVSQPSNIVDFSISQSARSSGNSFSHVSNSGMSKFQEVDSEIKVTRGFIPNCDVFNGLTRNITQNWAGPTFDSTQNSVSSAVFDQPGFSSNQQNGQNRIPFVISSAADNSSRIKSERLPGGAGFQTGLYPEQLDQEDLMSALLNQQQGMRPVENEFCYDGYQLDNLPM